MARYENVYYGYFERLLQYRNRRTFGMRIKNRACLLIVVKVLYVNLERRE